MFQELTRELLPLDSLPGSSRIRKAGPGQQQIPRDHSPTTSIGTTVPRGGCSNQELQGRAEYSRWCSLHIPAWLPRSLQTVVLPHSSVAQPESNLRRSPESCPPSGLS